MKTQSKQHSISYQSDDQVQDLMNSIQNKLSLLVSNDNSISQISPTKHKMCIKQLESSSPLHESRVITRINQMQQHYIKQIKQLNYKLVYLQSENYKLKQQCNYLHIKLLQLQKIANRNQQEFQRQLHRKLQHTKDHLINQLSTQTQIHYQRHLSEIKQLKQQLNAQKKRRKSLQQQLDSVNSQKESIEQFYRQLIQNHRKLIEADIKQSKNNIIDEKINHCTSKKQKITKQKIINKKNQKQLTKQQLIPVLAKGIQELKAKFKVK